MRRSADFTSAVRQGARTGRPRLVVHLTTGEPGPATAGFVVSKAVGGAVVRNQVKRRLRHLMRARIEALPPGSRLVVRALPSAAGSPSSALGSDLDDGLRRVLAKVSATSPARPGGRP